MHRLAVLFVALLLVNSVYGAQFSDVPRTHWAYDAIDRAVAAGVLQGYDGKFAGKRLLNRYQMAVITKNILENFQKGEVPAAAKSEVKLAQNLEALVIEFAEELALVSVRVASLEDTVQDLKKELNKPAQPVVGSDIGFTAFAAVALVFNDDTNGGATRYSNLNRGVDSEFFDVPQLSLGIDKDLGQGVYFHAQFDYNSDLGNAAGVGVNQAYFLVDELFGDIGAKIGAFAPPFSMEHNGPFRTLNMTITPSIANSYHNMYRFTGLEIQKTDIEPGEISWKFGIVSGSDDLAAAGMFLSDFHFNVNRVETDDGLGFYIWIGKEPEREGDFGWNFSYMDNGGDNNPGAGFTASPGGETDFFQVGFKWQEDEFTLLMQYLDGTSDTGADLDFTTFYVLLSYQVDERQSFTFRYDDVEQENAAASQSGDAFTIAYNRKITDNTMIQVEYCTPDDGGFGASGEDDFGDDLIQIRYKVHF